jgi:hypothetical protein
MYANSLDSLSDMINTGIYQKNPAFIKRDFFVYEFYDIPGKRFLLDYDFISFP